MIVLVILISGIPHAVNMFHYPYYENDEGVYMSQAWSMSKEGELAPYTYWYDHAPGGWALIAVWANITGGYFTFGTSINSGRVLMLLLHICSAILIYLITKKVTKNKWAGLLAVAIFSLSPLGIYFQRRVLLDNIMMFWLLFAAYLIIRENLRLRNVFLSAVFFAIAVLSKENAIFTLPAFLYGVLYYAEVKVKKFAIFLWILISGCLISLYPLFAFIKNEFFPALGDEEHVSLISTLQFHSGRGNPAPFWNPASDFFVNALEWISRDAFLMYVGAICFLLNLILCIWKKEFRFVTLLLLFTLLFFVRGGLIINFYILSLIPLLAINIAMTTSFVINKIFLNKMYSNLIFMILILVYIFTAVRTPEFRQLYIIDETTPQTKLIKWIKDNLDESDHIIIDNYAYVELHDNYYNDKIFKNADWFSKVKEDPEIKNIKFGSDWKTTDYIMLSHELARQSRVGEHEILNEAFKYAVPVVVYTNSQIPIDVPLRDFAVYTQDIAAILKVIK